MKQVCFLPRARGDEDHWPLVHFSITAWGYQVRAGSPTIITANLTWGKANHVSLSLGSFFDLGALERVHGSFRDSGRHFKTNKQTNAAAHWSIAHLLEPKCLLVFVLPKDRAWMEAAQTEAEYQTTVLLVNRSSCSGSFHFLTLRQTGCPAAQGTAFR